MYEFRSKKRNTHLEVLFTVAGKNKTWSKNLQRKLETGSHNPQTQPLNGIKNSFLFY